MNVVVDDSQAAMELGEWVHDEIVREIVVERDGWAWDGTWLPPETQAPTRPRNGATSVEEHEAGLGRLGVDVAPRLGDEQRAAHLLGAARRDRREHR